MVPQHYWNLGVHLPAMVMRCSLSGPRDFRESLGGTEDHMRGTETVVVLAQMLRELHVEEPQSQSRARSESPEPADPSNAVGATLISLQCGHCREVRSADPPAERWEHTMLVHPELRYGQQLVAAGLNPEDDDRPTFQPVPSAEQSVARTRRG